MADQEPEKSPWQVIGEKADALKLEGEDRDDFIQAKMARAGYKKGSGEWVKAEDDDSPQDDDDEPVTRGEWRRIQRERRQKEVTTQSPPKVTPKPEANKEKKDPWW